MNRAKIYKAALDDQERFKFYRESADKYAQEKLNNADKQRMTACLCGIHDDSEALTTLLTTLLTTGSRNNEK